MFRLSGLRRPMVRAMGSRRFVTPLSTPKQSAQLFSTSTSTTSSLDKENLRLMQEFHNSFKFDKVLCHIDLAGSRAYAKALCKSGLLTKGELDKMLKGLDQVDKEWESNTFPEKASDEDIHMANERRLTELIGDTAKKLHTGRSRNDQVATDLRMWTRISLAQMHQLVCKVIASINSLSRKHFDALMPGYTHLQRAQPVLVSHWLMSHAWPLKRDCERLAEISNRLNALPLGSGALAGNPFKIDRAFLAKELNFARLSDNSMDATSDRDFVAETLFASTMIVTHLSRFAEDLIIYSSKEFGFVRIPEPFSTGSSLMPQKRNPDSLELIRGKSGRVFGNMSGFLMTLKSLPSCYNKDLQEDKEPMIDSLRTLFDALDIFSRTLDSTQFNKKAMHAALSEDMLATDIAYYLVRKQIPFRTAHGVSRKVVRLAESKGVKPSELKLADFQSVDKTFDDSIYDVFKFSNSVAQYELPGGTAPNSVKVQVEKMTEWLKENYTEKV